MISGLNESLHCLNVRRGRIFHDLTYMYLFATMYSMNSAMISILLDECVIYKSGFTLFNLVKICKCEAALL